MAKKITELSELATIPSSGDLVIIEDVSASTTKKITVNNLLQTIYDGNGNELLKTSATASAVNELTVGNAATTGAPYIQATGGDTNIDVNLIPKGTGEVTKSGNPIDWWEEIGRTTLGSAGDTITVSVTAKKYLHIRVRAIGPNVTATLRFNSDSGSNYALRSNANDTEAASTSQTSLSIASAANVTYDFIKADVVNEASNEKQVIFSSTGFATAGAGTAPARKDGWGKWVNTSNQITSVDVVNAGSGDFAAGSEVIVLGHD